MATAEDFARFRAGLPAVPESAARMAQKSNYRARIRIEFDGDSASEPLVDLHELGIRGLNHYGSPENPPYCCAVPGSITRLWMRRSAAARLLEVNHRLAPLGLEVHVHDAWRPTAVQAFFHDVWFPEWLQARRPDLQGEALLREVETYWSAPTSDAASVAPHATGGAVDLTLVFRSSGFPLFMGGIFDDVTELAWTDWYERTPPISMSDDEARANRRLLFRVMEEAGFRNNPSEWWHYSYGDQMWAALSGLESALYGAVEPPDGAP